MTYRLTKEKRREVCVHEAAHAVVAALGGIFVYRLAVAPEGSQDWSCEGRKGGVLTDLFGVCQTADDAGAFYVEWDEAEWCYRMKNGMDKAYVLRRSSGKARQLFRTDVRASICCLLAGPAASQIWERTDVYLWEGEYTRTDDVTKAIGLAQLLHWRGEYEHLVDLTERTLRQPEVWNMVLRLADELEQKGDMDEFEGLLPEPVPNWPPSVRTKSTLVLASNSIG